MEDRFIPNDIPEVNKDNNKIVRYETYYNRVLVKEQPFYYQGMTEAQADKELKYLNDNLKAFYEGDYVPLWRQNLYK